ncbi:carbohydrate ABC transporter permease [Paenibacillus eucommiae]|uniref:Multiple sugar transport system permease protein n=1 Tax=Paenibacillus eucommiae TaxID=1355755 RepID=A0ABS4J2A8_9BACL|nr:carbohydrate ABC transporter permease [Paenibacillus eucommiae]MBP1993251.1 multiple sugar transport system permease protein [Paenibacillus eucommiae]
MDKANSSIGKWLQYVLLYGVSLVILFPFVWLLLSSFKDDIEIMSGNHLIPKNWTFQNYVTIMTDIPMLSFFKNSMFISVLATAGGILASAMSAFVFAKLMFKGRNTLFTMVLVVMMIPGVVTMIPLFIIIKSVGLMDSVWALILPNWTGSAFGVFFLRQHMLSIPHELYESAKLEGCSPLRVFASIYLPLVKPALATLAVLNFIAHWNDLLGPLIYLNSPEKMTVTVGISYFRGQYVTNYPVVLAGVFLSLLPTFILFLFAQKHLTRGMLISGLK